MKRRLLFLIVIYAGCLSAQNVQCQSSSGAWGPCVLNPPVQVATVAGTAQINNKISAGSGTTLTNAFPGNTTAGNTIVCGGFESAVTGSAVPVFTDSQSNTYISVVSGASAAPGYALSVANNIVGGTTDTITLTTVSGAAAFTCYELKGAVTVGQSWDYSGAVQATSTTLSIGQFGSVLPNEFAAVWVGMGAGTVTSGSVSIATVPNGLIGTDQQNTAPSGGAALSVFYSSHAVINNAPNFTQSIPISASETYSAMTVSIKPQASSDLKTAYNPCNQQVPSVASVNLTASGRIIVGVASKQTYLCAIAPLITATAQNIALVEGTGSTCGTNTAGMSGGATAATGWNFAANGGFVAGVGSGMINKTATLGDDVCLLLSGSGQTSGTVLYVQQ